MSNKIYNFELETYSKTKIKLKSSINKIPELGEETVNISNIMLELIREIDSLTTLNLVSSDFVDDAKEIAKTGTLVAELLRSIMASLLDDTLSRIREVCGISESYANDLAEAELNYKTVLDSLSGYKKADTNATLPESDTPAPVAEEVPAQPRNLLEDPPVGDDTTVTANNNGGKVSNPNAIVDPDYDYDKHADLGFSHKPIYTQFEFGEPYSNSTIQKSGCGITCIAEYLTNNKSLVTPADIAAKYRGDTINGGTSTGQIQQILNDYGVNVRTGFWGEGWGADSNDVMNSLAAGKSVIFKVGNGPFTQGGHYIMGTGLTADGKIQLYDPSADNWGKYSEQFKNGFDPKTISCCNNQYFVLD